MKKELLNKDTSASAPVSNPIIDGVIWKQLLLYFFPILVGSFCQQLYNTVDTVIVGQFVGTNALAAVGGSAAQITSLVFYLITGLSTGATVAISQFIGAKKPDLLDRNLHCAYAFAIVGSIVFTIIGLIVTPIVLEMMNTEAVLMEDAILYLRIFFAGLIFSFIYNMGSGILRAAGDSRRPLYYLMICCVVNIVLDLVFVLWFRMGVAGVAIATVIAQAVSAVLVTISLMRSYDMMKLDLRRIRIFPAVLAQQMRIGVPAAINSIMYCLANIIIQSSLNTFGTDAVAACAAFGKLDAVYWMISSAFGTSICTFVGQNYGARKMDRVHKSVRVCMVMSFAVSALIIVGLFAARVPLFRIFTTDAAVVAMGVQMLELIVPCYILYVPIEIFSCTLRGMGDVILPTILTLSGVCVLRIVWIVFLVPLFPAVSTVLMSYPVSWGVTAVLFIVYYLWYWKKRK